MEGHMCVAERQNSHTPDEKTLPAKRNCEPRPALCAVILFGVMCSISVLETCPSACPESMTLSLRDSTLCLPCGHLPNRHGVHNQKQLPTHCRLCPRRSPSQHRSL